MNVRGLLFVAFWVVSVVHALIFCLVLQGQARPSQLWRQFYRYRQSVAALKTFLRLERNIHISSRALLGILVVVAALWVMGILGVQQEEPWESLKKQGHLGRLKVKSAKSFSFVGNPMPFAQRLQPQIFRRAWVWSSTGNKSDRKTSRSSSYQALWRDIEEEWVRWGTPAYREMHG